MADLRLGFRAALLLMLSWAAGTAAPAAPANPEPPLTSIAQIHRLTPEQSARNPQVQFTGIVTLCLSSNSAFVQDASDGVLVLFAQVEIPLRPGLSAQISGQVRPGQYAPVVFRGRLKPAAEPLPMPVARPLSFDAMLEDRNHALWIETVGVVRCIPPSQTPGTYLEVAAGQSRILVIMTEVKGQPVPPELFDATVRLRGVCAALFNERKQIRGAKIYVSDFTDITVLEPAVPLDRLSPQPIASLERSRPRSLYPHRELFRGTVTHQVPAPTHLLFVADPSGATVVQLQENQPAAPVGSRVEVSGYPETGAAGPIWADATVRILAEGLPPAPVPVQAERLLDGDHNAQLVLVRGRLLNVVNSPDGWTLFVQAGQLVMGAQLPAGPMPHALSTLAPDTVLDLTGIVESEPDEIQQARRPRLLLRTPEDIRVVTRPPWWDHTRVAIAAGCLALLILGGVAWVISLRVQIARQVATLRDQLRREGTLEQQYRELYDNTRDIIYTEDKDGRVISVNPAIDRLAGYTEAEFLGLAPGAWHLSGPQEQYRAWMERHRLGRTADSFELELKTRNGRRLVLDVHAHATPDGTDGRVLCIGRDVTDRKTAEEELRRAKQQLEAANQDLAARNAEMHKTNLSLQEEITERQRAEAGIAQALKQLWDASRQAGKAEMASSVLHNVGNVLNSVGVSASLIARQIGHSSSGMVARVAELLQKQESGLGAFLTRDEKGRRLPGYLEQLARGLRDEQAALLREAETLTRNLALVRNVIALQQNYARVSETVETVPLRDVAEDALFIHTASDSWHHIEITRDYQDLTPVTINRQQALHLLFNLLQNAQHACDEADISPKRITLRISRREDQRVILEVTDNGIGIPPGNLDKLFTYGFTTRENGQGFGLHNAAQSARQMGGSLAARSQGVGRGATFTLELPLKPPAARTPGEAAPSAQ